MSVLNNEWFLRAIAGEGEAGGDVETGGDVTTPPAGGDTEPEVGDTGTGRSQLRKQLEKNFDTDRKVREKAEVKEKTTPKAPRRVAGGAEIDDVALAAAAGTEKGEVAEPEVVPKDITPAPEAFSKEAKAEWEKTPPQVQQAILKREQDVAKGIQELKGRYVDIDKALEPHVDAIRKHGHTPAQAVNQLFSWFQALAANPEQAFPALAKSFNYDIAKLAAVAEAKPADGKAPVEGQPDGQLPEAVQKYINDLTQKVTGLEQVISQKVGSLESTFQQQSEAKTQEVLMGWAKDKPHFEAVRGLMAQLIASGAVPMKEGRVDLDGAYDMAIYSNPEVRGKLLAEQEAVRAKVAKDKADKEKVAQQAQADKARRAGVNITGGAPGASGPIAGRPGKKGKSVRESLADAMEEITK